MRPVLLMLVATALGLSACGHEVNTGGPSVPVRATAVTVRSAVVKRSGGRLVTAIRGTTVAGAKVTVRRKTTTANADGTWAIRTTYNRALPRIRVVVAGGETTVRQPLRPLLRVSSSTGVTTTTDLTVLKGRVAVTRGRLGRVRVTVNGSPATVVGSRWSKTVTVSKGTRHFTVRATSRAADSDFLSISKTRRLSASEKAARAARREAARQAKIAAKQAAKLAKAQAIAAKRAAAAAKKAAAQSACDPSYSPQCLKDGIGDYDCAGGSGDGPNYVDGPVDVTGDDPFDLDRDGNGVGCQS